jgi:hypothetical protein
MNPWPDYEPDPLHVKLKLFEKNIFSGDGQSLFADWMEWGKQYLDQIDLLQHAEQDDTQEPPLGEEGDENERIKMKRYRSSNRKKTAFWWTNQLKVGSEAQIIAKRYKNKPRSLIKALEVRYDPKSSTLLEKLKDEKRAFKMRPNEKIDLTNRRLEDLCQKLYEQGKEVEDSKKRDLLVRALKNAEWDEHLRTAREKISQDNTVSHTAIYKLLKEREYEDRERERNRVSDTATVVNGVSLSTVQQKKLYTNLQKKFGTPAGGMTPTGGNPPPAAASVSTGTPATPGNPTRRTLPGWLPDGSIHPISKKIITRRKIRDRKLSDLVFTVELQDTKQ